jgi:hypothetical protein
MEHENGTYVAAVSNRADWTTVTVFGKCNDKDQGFIWHRRDVSLSGADLIDILDYGLAEWKKQKDTD